MSQSASVWLVILVAFGAANLPFLAPRLLGVIPLPASLGAKKSLGVRLVELVILYFLSGLLGLLLEKRAGQIAPQDWQFYAVTGALFLTFAFPGFTYRYLLKHRS